jgi:N-acetylmuramoyl-L-alanine amidase
MKLPAIILDPGHGGRDPGCVVNGFIEKDFVFGLAKELDASLSGLGWPVEAVLSRDADTDIPLHFPAELAEKHEAILTLSLHVDGSGNGDAHGLMCFAKYGDEPSRAVARNILRAAPRALMNRPVIERVQRGDKYYPRVWDVLEPHKGTAVLVECGFCTNPSDRSYLNSVGGQRGIIAALLVGISQAIDDWGAGHGVS